MLVMDLNPDPQAPRLKDNSELRPHKATEQAKTIGDGNVCERAVEQSTQRFSITVDHCDAQSAIDQSC